MKHTLVKKVTTSLLLVSFVLQAAPALAQTATRTPERIRERLQERRTDIRQRLAEHRKENIRRFYQRMLRRFEAALERQERMARRIEFRLNKFAERGKDVSAQRVKLQEARSLIAEGRADVATIRQKFETMVNADNPRAAFEEVRQMVKDELVGAVKKIHRLLVDIITGLKGASGAGPAATSTPATSSPSTP